jgi:hypothetical protein
MTWPKVSLRWTVLAVCLSQALSFRGIDCISVENTPTGLYLLQLPGLEWDGNKSHNAVCSRLPLLWATWKSSGVEDGVSISLE